MRFDTISISSNVPSVAFAKKKKFDDVSDASVSDHQSDSASEAKQIAIVELPQHLIYFLRNKNIQQVANLIPFAV